MLSKKEEYNLLKDVKTTFDNYAKNVNEFAEKHALDRLPLEFLSGFGAVLNGYLKIIEEDKSKEMVDALKVPIYGIKARYNDETIQKGAIKEIQQILDNYLHDLEQELDIKPQQTKEEKTEDKKESVLLRDAVKKILDKYEKEKAQEKNAKEQKFLDEIFGKTNQ